jgi:hypothetical protein
LWDSQNLKVAVIDHNLAFDTEFDPQNFKDHHIFGHYWDELSSDLVTRLSYQQYLEVALPAFDVALASMPKEWLWIDAEQTIPTKLNINQLRNQLLRCKTEKFWRAE